MSVKRLVPLHAVALESDPIGTRMGEIYYNTTAEELKFYDGTSWHAVSGAIQGILEHTHTYDGEIFSTESFDVVNPGKIDGGGA